MYGNVSGTMSGNMSGTMSGTMSSTTSRKEEDEQDDNTLYDEAKIEWINLIFLPFHPIFQFVVLVCALHKVILGPLDTVFGLSAGCVYALDISVYTKIMQYFNKYPATIIYFIDTFLHIVHRQVADKAVRREHLPKSAFLIILDIVALIPFEDLMAEDPCIIRLWPNILGFVEFLIVYRIVQYFDLISTHTCWKQYIGFTIFMFALLNCVVCFLCLLTFHGLCTNCASKSQNSSVVYYDWRIFFDVANQTSQYSEKLQMYFFSWVYLMSFTTGFTFDNSRPVTLAEHYLAIVFMYSAYILDHVVILPKLFSESVLSLRRICTFDPFIQKIIYEIKRRNPSPRAHASVKDFYDLIWKQRSGITCSPRMLKELPRYLRLEIREDLVWPVFYHSPTFRKTSIPFKRFICDSIRYDYKLPGEKLFAGPHCQSNMYYLKSGIVQLMSYDDGMTPILSVTAGTIFGDISFFSPPLRRKIIVKCLNYCEVLYVTRGDVLKALHRYPGDRKAVFDLAQDKIKHARDLYKCKQNIKGLDRTEDEGIDWLKRRWWEISDCVDLYRKRGRRLTDRCELPAEETTYHCAKYIGQLMLTTDVQLKQSSLFVNDEFPWILAPNSILYRVWQNFVIGVVIFVLVYFPPNISKLDVSSTFTKWKYFVDFVYISDICMSLLTAVDAEDATSNFASVMLIRFKKPAFVMDILASLWIEQITKMVDKPQYYHACLFNRLLKIYLLFPSEGSTWKLGQDTMFPIYTRVFFTYFSFIYISAFLLLMLIRLISELSPLYFFGSNICENPNQSERDCLRALHPLWVPWKFLYTFIYNDLLVATIVNIVIKLILAYVGHLIFMYLRSRFMAGMYLRFRDALSYQRFVTTLRGYYRHHEIHTDLMIRLERYLSCHWKYHQGVDVMRPNSLKEEPYDIFWKTQGEVAEKIIGESLLFIDADPAVVKDLAHVAKFLLMPKDSILAVLGVVCTNITWIVQGHVKIEYYDEAGQLQQRLYTAGHMVAATSSLLGKPSLRTYAVDTDCEIVYVSLNTFQKIMQRHPHEWENLNSSINEYMSEFDEVYYSYLRKNVDYHRKLRERINTGRRYTVLPPPVQTHSPLIKSTRKKTKIIKVDTELYIKPDSGFMKYWMPFRAFTVLLAIVGSSLQGGAGARFKWHLTLLNTLCTAISVVDIALKFFLAYYDERGILISTKLKTITNYLTRTFIMDVTGTLPWDTIVSLFLLDQLPEGHAKVINTLSGFAHLYIIMGYFDYLADRPSSISAIIKIAKWQLTILLFMLAGSHFLINLCVRFSYNQEGTLVNMTRLESCWMPYYQPLDNNPSMDQLHMLFAQSLNLAQSGLLNANHGEFQVAKKDQLLVAATLVVLGAIYWYVMAYSVTLLVLVSRSNTLFEHGVHQLRSFLKSERVETDLINQTMCHFHYWRKRTNGINLQTLMFERVGVVFRQDLSYYFFKSTYLALDSILEGGDQFQRLMASLSSQMYFLPNEEIMRELDIMPFVYVVHRGRVVIMQNDEKLAVLTKGSLFGQLTGRMPRPVIVTAIADSYADVLKMSITEFNEALTSELRATINSNQQSKNDYIATKKVFQENPRDTIKYLLRGRKTIKLPFMLGPKEAHTGNWYNRWLYVALLFIPAITVYFTALLSITPPRRRIELFRFLYIFVILDVFHIVHMVLEYYTVEVAIIGNRCVNRKVGWRSLKDWRLYANVISLVVPLLSYMTRSWYFTVGRFLRVSLFYDFYIHFCRRKSSWAPVIFKTIILILLMHGMVCGWIHFGCKRPLPVTQPPLTPQQLDLLQKSTDLLEWSLPRVDRPNGCNKPTFFGHFVVPRKWYNDYSLAVCFIAQLHANVELGNASQMTIKEIYYKILISVILYLVNIWMISTAIGYIYTKYRELFHYDYDVLNMSLYLRYSGLAPSLLRSVIQYTTHLWNRQRGNWMPELAMQAPTCLKEDIFSALYLHHILTPPLFRKLPEYFTRQMASRVKRTVIFPGKAVVQEGDIYSVMYFIHEGEIEKWYNYNSPEKKLASLLSTNGYFGFIPGLFPNTRFLFTYVSRTVVDLISLNLNDWQDLLHAYPDVKLQLYEGAKQMKSEVKKEGQSIFPV